MPARERFLGTATALMFGIVMVTGALVFVPGGSAALTADAWITGVVDDGSDPLPGVYIKAMMFVTGSIDVGYAFTDSNGEYTIGVMGGFEYMVIAADGDYYMTMGSATPDVDETVWVNITMTEISPIVADVVVKGYVLDEWGTPATDGHVLGISYDEFGGDMPNYANVTTPDGIGYFEVNVIASPAGGGAVAFDNPGFTMVDNSSESALVSGNEYWFNITLRSGSEVDDATIHGQVTAAGTGMPLEGVLVSIESWNDFSEGYSNYTFTDSSGNYVMNVMNGTANIWFMKGGYSWVMLREETIPEGADVLYDASLVALDCVVRGNVTDLKTDARVEMARVILMDSEDNAVMAMTDDMGYYELDAFSGEDMWLVAQADGYSQDYTFVTLGPGDEVWYDFYIHPLSAWIEGTVLDAISGSPIEGARVWADSDTHSGDDETDGAGHYSIAVAPGDYNMGVSAPGYRDAYANDVTVLDETTTVQGFHLLPSYIPETVMVSGYVTESATPDPIQDARVRIAYPDWSYWNETRTDEFGYYEMYVAPLDGQPVSFTANSHAPYFTTVDCAGETSVSLDAQLAPDMYGPNITLLQAPDENVSWTNPMTTDLEVQDENLRQMMLWSLMPWYSEGGYDHKYIFGGAQVSFDPFEPSSGLEYTQVGDTYYIHQEFDGTADTPSMIGGWIDDGSDQYYMAAMKQWWGPELMYAFRAYYSNDTLDNETGAAYFDSDTGEYLLFHFDNWMLPQAEPDDASGVIVFVVNDLSFNETDPAIWIWNGESVLCEASVQDLVFVPDPVVPTGEYVTMFMANDFGDQWNMTMAPYTVDNGIPMADAGGDQNVVEDVEVTLDGSGSGDDVGIVSYTWEFDDGGLTTLTGMVTSYIFSDPGAYEVTLTVVDGAGHEDTDLATIYVSVDAPPVADAGEDFSVNESEVAVFNGTGSSDDTEIITNYTWTIVDLAVELYGETPDYVFVEPGMYDVELVVTDSLGQLSDPDTVTVTVLDITAPVADAGEDQEDVPYGTVVYLNGSLSSDNVAVVNWTWTFEDDDESVVLYGMNVAYTFSEPGTFNVTLTVADAAENEDVDWMNVTVVDDEPPVADAGPDPEGVVAGQSVTFNGEGSTDNHLIVDYTWTFEEDSEEVILSGVTTQYAFMVVGDYVVTLTVEDASGNSDTDTVVVRVGVANEGPTADAGDDQLDVVEGDTVIFDGSGSSDDVAIENYTWTFTYDGDPVSLYGQTVTFKFDVPGTYVVTLTVTDAEGETSTDTLVVVVSEKSTAFITEYWWLFAVVAAVVVIAALAMLMMRGKGGHGKESDAGEELEEEDLPPPDADDM